MENGKGSYDMLKETLESIGLTMDDFNSLPKLTEERKQDIIAAENILKETVDKDCSFTHSFNEPFNGTGAVSVANDVITINNPKKFAEIFKKADFMEIYLMDDKPIIEFTYHGKER